MRIGLYQFAASADIAANAAALQRGIEKAASQGVRLLAFQECAATGYPPLETPSVVGVDFDALASCINLVCASAKKHALYIALGSIRTENSAYFNSLLIIAPDGTLLGHYDKRALWGWDVDNFSRGISPGIFDIDGQRIAFRICFEIRFPEYFRELFVAQADACIVSFCDTAAQASLQRYEAISAFLRTRAMENVLPLYSVNSISQNQTAPTAAFDINGNIIAEAPRNQEFLLVHDLQKPEIGFGERGRIENSRRILLEK